MASTEHKNRRKAIAFERLNIAVLRLAEKHGVNAIDLPKKLKDKDMREIMIFERMADFLETLGGQDVPQLEENPLVIKQANRATPQLKSTRKTKQASPAMEAK
jgi:hypothetical protein